MWGQQETKPGLGTGTDTEQRMTVKAVRRTSWDPGRACLSPWALCAMRTVSWRQWGAVRRFGGVMGNLCRTQASLSCSARLKAPGGRCLWELLRQGLQWKRELVPGHLRGSLHQPWAWAQDTGIWDPVSSPFCSCGTSSDMALAFSVSTLPCA